MLNAGTKLGPYEIVASLGAGGMGEVYRARDTRLDRAVAIKILPAALAADPQFRERFDREARAISQLTHPHICTLFDVGEHEGTAFLVMELLEGETLEARLNRAGSTGPGLQIDQALTIAIEIASALDAAHRAGIVHRDLKPGNVMLTKSGAKLLDFGLAKTNAPVVAVSGTMMPTTPHNITAQGTILGTFQYMAPEQIEGIEADARTDIFAFGCVLFEMLTGRKAFEGKTRASLLGAILKDEPPPVSQVQPVAPASLDRIVTTCLAKEPDDRWQSARDLMRELKWVSAGGVSSGLPTTDSRLPTRSSTLAWAVAGAALILAGVLLTLWAPWRTVSPPAPVRLTAELGADVSLDTTLGTSLALSADGSVLAFVAQKSGSSASQLYVRRLGQLVATPLSGSDGAFSPFFSPDGQWLAFFAESKLKKISVTGGAAIALCDAPNGRGGSWAEDGTIVFTPQNGPGVTLLRVPAAGGKPEPLTTLAEGEVTQRWPQILPGGKAVLYSGSATPGGFEDANIVVQPLPSGARKIVQRGGFYGRYLLSGHLVFMHEGTLFAAAFDLDRLDTTGPPVPLVESVAANAGGGSAGAAHFAVSSAGTLAYLAGQGFNNSAPIHWLTRDGKATLLRSAFSNWSNPQFAPDGRRLAMEIFDGRQWDVWTYEWARDTLSRLTFEATDDEKPVWTPDGRRIAFAARRRDQSNFNLYWQRADGTGEAQRLTESKNVQFPVSWHPSGKFLAFTEQAGTTQQDLMILPMEGDEASGWKPGKPTVFLNSPFVELEPMFSPDGRWIAYFSNETGRLEVYVRPFPGPGSKWQISTDGGTYPSWSRTRQELFYSSAPDQRIMVASYSVAGDAFRPDKPRLWSDARFTLRPRQRSLDLHPDGERFALSALPASQAAAKQDKVGFIFNFFDELRRVAPAARR